MCVDGLINNSRHTRELLVSVVYSVICAQSRKDNTTSKHAKRTELYFPYSVVLSVFLPLVSTVWGLRPPSSR